MKNSPPRVERDSSKRLLGKAFFELKQPLFLLLRLCATHWANKFLHL